MSSRIKILIAGVLSGVLFVFMYGIFKMDLIITFLLSIAAYVGLGFLLDAKDDPIYVKSTTLTERDIKTIISQAEHKLDKIRKNQNCISSATVKEQIERILTIGTNIIEDFKKDPKDIKAGRRFLNYYLDTTDKIVEKYAVLSAKTNFTPEETDTLKRVENMLSMIEETFHKTLSKLQRNDYMDLDAELSVLEMTMKSEGIQ